ncbi:hypothetical protein ALC56_11215, partial [Trachymyrmex septentrionalis]
QRCISKAFHAENKLVTIIITLPDHLEAELRGCWPPPPPPPPPSSIRVYYTLHTRAKAFAFNEPLPFLFHPRNLLYLHTRRMGRIGNEGNWSGTANARIASRTHSRVEKKRVLKSKTKNTARLRFRKKNRLKRPQPKADLSGTVHEVLRFPRNVLNL